MKFKYFDTHTHTNYPPLCDEIDNIIKVIEENQIGINIVGCNKQTCELATEQVRLSEYLYCSLGIHPNDIDEWNNLDEMINFLETLYLNNKDKVLCIGECGLDYYYNNDETTKIKQKNAFIAQIELAKKYNLPVMMHIRDAHSDAQEIIEKYKHLELTWIVHCFTSDKTNAIKYIDLGCYVSIPGVVTFKNAIDLNDSLSSIPMDKILTETDAPWLSPVPYRGKTNYPYYVLATNDYLAKKLNLNSIELNKQLCLNACKALRVMLK